MVCLCHNPQAHDHHLQRYQRIAPLYDLLDLPFEYGRYRRIRPLLFTGLTGRILDAGVGTGRNAPFYPHGSSIVGIDLSPAMLARAEGRRPQAVVPVELRQMDVTHLDFPPASFRCRSCHIPVLRVGRQSAGAGAARTATGGTARGNDPAFGICPSAQPVAQAQRCNVGAVGSLGLRRQL
jgi:SAM-dependent methyltransferase